MYYVGFGWGIMGGAVGVVFGVKIV